MIGNLSDLLTGSLVTGAAVVIGLLIRQELMQLPQKAHPAVENIRDWGRATARVTSMGNSGTPPELAVFSDFQCPFSAQVAPDLARLRREYRISPSHSGTCLF